MASVKMFHKYYDGNGASHVALVVRLQRPRERVVPSRSGIHQRLGCRKVYDAFHLVRLALHTSLNKPSEQLEVKKAQIQASPRLLETHPSVHTT